MRVYGARAGINSLPKRAAEAWDLQVFIYSISTRSCIYLLPTQYRSCSEKFWASRLSYYEYMALGTITVTGVADLEAAASLVRGFAAQYF